MGNMLKVVETPWGTKGVMDNGSLYMSGVLTILIERFHIDEYKVGDIIYLNNKTGDCSTVKWGPKLGYITAVYPDQIFVCIQTEEESTKNNMVNIRLTLEKDIKDFRKCFSHMLNSYSVRYNGINLDFNTTREIKEDRERLIRELSKKLIGNDDYAIMC